MHDRIKISIHAPRAGCDSTRRGFPAFAQISIHAPRAGCDPTRVRPPIRWAISIHVPRAGCDRRALTQVETLSISIHVPRAGCDEKHMQSIARCANFNPRTPCGVRLTPQTALAYMLDISIHVPRAGCDRSSVHSSLISGSFQSTYPVRGATRQRYRHDHPAHISIHVPRAGCDRPRSSCPDPARAISIHVPRAGCDGKFDDFNPLNLHKRYKRVLDRPKSTSEQGKNKAKLAYIHVFTVFLGGAKVPELSARFYFAPNTVRLSARPWRHSPLWHRNARCGCDTYPQGSKSADCLRIHP